ncbi:glycoside hydrolase family 18 protein [Photorhabdus luminescens]|uniref:glycoside hydrolase family 18 protein n=1 Tax=Photorhabdus luminescens TaxID=29488 RepID=UPI00223F0323|nr:glycoside hydrolase family 18 protein [Photorhabdus luminescens]MCW7760423.1 glycoside hydrolase family 18 protein [Photorhabdus luminescens subsp. venezuelensis]
MTDNSKYQYTCKKVMSDASENIGAPLTAWSNQSGGETYYVIFDGQVYKNTYWVERWHIPQRDNIPSYENAWIWVRTATNAEIEKHGNPTQGTVEPIPGDVDILKPDALTEETYQEKGYKPNGSGTNLAYTSARVCHSLYNQYETDRTRPKVSAYITDWCQYDARLPAALDDSGKKEEDDKGGPGRGFNLKDIPATDHDRLIFNISGIHGNIGEKSDRINLSAEGWNKQLKPGDPPIITDWRQYDTRSPAALDDSGKEEDKDGPGRGFNLEDIPATAYDRLVFSFLGIYGDTGKKSDRINLSAEGWNKQLKPGDPPITFGHIVPVDPYGDLGTTRNVGLPAEDKRDAGPNTFLQFYNQQAASGLLGGLRNLQQKAKLAGHRLELAFSIGGWSMSGYFSPMLKDNTQRETFINSIVDFFQRFPMFTAVDIDWEYPGAAGEEGNEFDPINDGPNYAILIKELRQALDRAFGTSARKQITIASSAVVGKLKKSNIKELIRNGLDNIFVMTYDFFGNGWAEHIGHHTNLYSPYYASDDPDRLYDISSDEAIKYLIEVEGVPPGKIHLGFANYGRSCIGANLETRQYNRNPDNPAPALGTMENGAPEFFCLLNNQFDCEQQLAWAKNGFKLMTDTATDADFLYNSTGGHFISLDTPRTVFKKGIYATEHKLGGIFSWSGDQDCGLLANAAREGTGYIPIKGKEKIDMGPLYNRGELIELPDVNSGKK